MKFTIATSCLLVLYTGLANAATGCRIELLNFNQAVVGSACIPFNYNANIIDSSTRQGYNVKVNNICGADFSGGQRTVNYSLRKAGYC
ncbi:uncharacterized protein CTRU02_209220 [Colletotrichum truncatum]|uniref:Uncharacterized protein n=1 Tax=Colletotrichum truncatum TaxID=5467 RepID=A0ACC3YYL4_COLTU|nr:uncharacterized protein CTRU02_14601 [Colletotrichum truncatum]KAF6782045.1 hypothetical protein CTRU02_14601 [Colletotrichum truncatum]